MFKDKELRKVFRRLVEKLGGEAVESLYCVGGIYGINKILSDWEIDERIRKNVDGQQMALTLIYSLLDYLNLEVQSGERIVRKSSKPTCSCGDTCCKIARNNPTPKRV